MRTAVLRRLTRALSKRAEFETKGPLQDKAPAGARKPNFFEPVGRETLRPAQPRITKPESNPNPPKEEFKDEWKHMEHSWVEKYVGTGLGTRKGPVSFQMRSYWLIFFACAVGVAYEVSHSWWLNREQAERVTALREADAEWAREEDVREVEQEALRVRRLRERRKPRFAE